MKGDAPFEGGLATTLPMPMVVQSLATQSVAASFRAFRLVLALMEVGDGGVDLRLHLIPVPGFELVDSLVDLVQDVFFVSTLVSLVGLGDAVFGGGA